MTRKILLIFLFFFIAAMALSPRFSLGYLTNGFRSVDVRIEDFLLTGALTVWLFLTLKKGNFQFKPSPLFWPIIIFLIFSTFSVLINLLFSHIALDTAFFYFLKEIEFFIIYFFVFYCAINFNIVSNVLHYWLIFMVLNIMWLISVFSFKISHWWYYGPNIFSEPRGPFPSGGFFLILFIFYFNLYFFHYSKKSISKVKKYFLFFLCLLPAVGVISSGSRTAAIGLFTSLFISFIIYFFYKLSFGKFIKIFSILCLLFFVFWQIAGFVNLTKRIFTNNNFFWEYTSNSNESRFGILKNNLANFIDNLPQMIIGVGVYGEAHSQYVRVLLERGIIGFILFAWIIWSILHLSWKGFLDNNNTLKKSLSAGLFTSTLSMLVMAIPNDVFMVVKIDQVYWFFAALTAAEIFKSNLSEVKN